MKAKSRKARETRAAYRVRTKRVTGKPRARLTRARKVAATVPWEQRIAPTDEPLMEWDAWLSAHEVEFEKKYPGNYLAIWDKRILAASTNGDEIYRLARQAAPSVIPLVTYIPRADEMPIVVTPFPAVVVR